MYPLHTLFNSEHLLISCLSCHRASEAHFFLPATATPFAIHQMEEYLSIRGSYSPPFFFRVFRGFRG